MNQEECLQTGRASTQVRKYFVIQQEKSPSEAKTYYKSSKLHVTCDRKVWNLKLTRFYFLNENKTKS